MVNRFLQGYKYTNKSYKNDMLILSVRATDAKKVKMFVVWIDRKTLKNSDNMQEVEILRKDMCNWNIAS